MLPLKTLTDEWMKVERVTRSDELKSLWEANPLNLEAKLHFIWGSPLVDLVNIIP